MEAGIEGVMEAVRKNKQTLLCRLRARERDFSSCIIMRPRIQERQQALSQVLPSAGPAIVCTILQLAASTIRRFKTKLVRYPPQAVGCLTREREREREKLVMVAWVAK